MLKAKGHKILLKKTRHGFENEGAFNPACIKENGNSHLFYRAVRKGNFSSIGYCELEGPDIIKHRHKKPILFPEHQYESQGIEDPRITKIDDIYYLTYSAYDSINVFGAYATSENLKSFRKRGIITPKFTYKEYKRLIECSDSLNEKYLFHYKLFVEHGLGNELTEKLYVWDKNIMFFPKKINGKFALLHRIHPGIQLVLFKNFKDLTHEFWEDYLINLEKHIVLDPELRHESSHIGGGCPPIETDQGWLIIYHTAEDTPHGIKYHASAALLELNDPTVEIARLKRPLISPSHKWEKSGFVNNIIFPSGTALFGDDLYIYYGAADCKVAIASVKLDSLLEELIKCKTS